MKLQTVASWLISLIVFIRPLEDCISSDSNRGFVDQQNRTVKDGPVHDKKQLNKSRMAISLSSVEIRMSQLQNTIWDDGRFGDSDPTHPSCTWPANSSMNYLYGGGFWVGGRIVDTDETAVSAAFYQGDSEWIPDTEIFVDFTNSAISDMDTRLLFNDLDETVDDVWEARVDTLFLSAGDTDAEISFYGYSATLSDYFICHDYTITFTDMIGDSVEYQVWDHTDGVEVPFHPNRSDGTCALTAGDWGDVHQSWFRDRDNLIYVQGFYVLIEDTGIVPIGPGDVISIEFSWVFNAGTHHSLGLEVTQQTYAWEGDNFIIHKYTIQNLGTQGSLTDVFAGLFCDFDIAGEGEAGDDFVMFDDFTQTSYMVDGPENGGSAPGYVGIHGLDGGAASHSWWSIDNEQQTDSYFYSLMSSGTIMESTAQSSDYRIIQSVGPFDIDSGQRIEVFFALVIGSGLEGLRATCDEAERRYQMIVPDTVAPSDPQGLVAVPGDGRVTLHWNANPESDMAYYKIYRDQMQWFTPSLANLFAEIDHPGTLYVDTGLINGQTYYYRVSAVDTVGNESGFSEEVRATPVVESQGLLGHYFDDMHLMNLITTRVDPGIHFDWGDEAPIVGMESDHFSVRWEGNILIDSEETYTFYLYCDDGAILWIDENIVIDHWHDQDPAEHSGSITLMPGYHSITLIYYENWGGAVCRLSWSSPSVPKQIIPAENLYIRADYNQPVSPRLNGPNASSGHYGNDRGDHHYVLSFNVRVIDPQGLNDVTSVNVTGPGGAVYTLRDDEPDGWYDARSGNYSGPPESGAYTFRAMDQSGNWAETIDTVTAVLDYPRNVRPAHNEVITTSTPTFSWEAVQGAIAYWVRVRDIHGNDIWRREDLTSTSIDYNDDGNATQDLIDGHIYSWTVQGYDSDGNWCEQNEVRFTYSTNPAVPVLSVPYVGSMHNGDDKGNEGYGLELYANVSDPQGLGDIQSVTVTSPDGTVFSLYDDGGHNDNDADDGRYGDHVWDFSQPPFLGEYIFTVTDHSNNTTIVTDTLDTVLDYPRNVRPRGNEVVTTATPTFRWDAVEGVSTYQVWVGDVNGRELWQRNDITESWVVYNDDGRGEPLIDGQTYNWNVSTRLDDASSWHDGVRFIYSANPMLPILSGPWVRSRHWVGGDLPETWSIDFWVNVGHPQGLSEIDSVWVEGPDGVHYQLFDDGEHSDDAAGDGRYAHYIDGLNYPPIVGSYFFKISDKSGNLITSVDTLTRVLDYPRNVRPGNNEIISAPDFTIEWDEVEGAAWYEVNVNTPDWSREYWNSGRDLIQTSIQYNADGRGDALADGGVYLLTIRAGDGKNESEREVKIAYRTDGRHTIYADSANTSGMEDGTETHPFDTITEALNATIYGDTVLVAGGTYSEHISMADGVTLFGAGPESTTIRGNVTISTSNVCISRFTIKGETGGAVDIHPSSNVEISYNVIISGHGAGIGLHNGPSPSIINNTIAGNFGAGIHIGDSGSAPIISNNIIVKNDMGIDAGYGNFPKLSYNNVWSNSPNYNITYPGQTDISTDPIFVDLTHDDNHLQPNSPCIDAGDPETPLDPDGTRADMGALYFDQRNLYPAAPMNLSATAGNQIVMLSWSPNTEINLSHYQIYRSETQGFTPAKTDSIGKVIAPGSSYTDTGLINDNTYYYRISAVTIFGDEGPFSEEVSATPSLYPEIAVNTFEIDFGDVMLGETKDEVLTVYSTGTDTLEVSTEILHVIMTPQETFTILFEEGTFSVQPGDSHEIFIRFSPFKKYATEDGILYLYNNTINNRVRINLTGNGVEHTISVLPNPFTPNNDGYNDFVEFEFPGMLTDPSDVFIFNVSGREVMKLSTPTGNRFRWYGVDDGNRSLEPGVYIYLIRVNGKNISNGTVTLMR